MGGRRLKICLIGAGNVATHLGRALGKVARVAQVYSLHLANAEALAASIDGAPEAIDSLEAIIPDADLYLISVTDDHISAVVEATASVSGGIWAHTSGSVSISVFEGKKERYGSFYPLQTFSKSAALDLRGVPMLIEGSDEGVANELAALAASISDDVKMADSAARMKLHIAAVFACNFANYMWTNADMLLRESGLTIQSIMPLLRETLAKLSTLTPEEAQTGPARRGDTEVIAKHLSALSGLQAEIYRLLSNDILNHYHTH